MIEPAAVDGYTTPATTLEGEERRLRGRLSKQVRALRLAAGLTLKAAAERCEMHWRHWQKLEAGEVNVTMATLVRVARALRVDVVELFDPSEPDENGANGA
jgi:transcriptional regulator with XRE-family HTH domain